MGNYRLSDSHEYINSSEMILNGHFFEKAMNYEDAENLTKRTIGYPIFTILSLISNDFVLILFQTLVGILNIWLIFKIFVKMGGMQFNLLTLVLFFTPSIFIYTHLIMSEVIAMTIVLTIHYLLLHQENEKNHIFIHLLIALLILVKPVFYLFAFVNLAIYLFYSFKKKRVYLSMFIPLIVVLGYLQFNKFRTDYYHFSSIQNINLIDYNLRNYKINKNGLADADRWLDSVHLEAEKIENFKKRNEFYSNIAHSEIENNFTSYFVYHFKTAIRGVFDPGRFDIFSTFNKNLEKNIGFTQLIESKQYGSIKELLFSKFGIMIIILLPIFIINFLKIFFVLNYIYKNIREFDFARLYLIILSIYYIFITGPVNSSRYMLVLQGVFITYAIISYEKFRIKLSEK